MLENGFITMAGIQMIYEKVDEPKLGAITFKKGGDGNVLGRVWCKNRFGTEKNLLTIEYGKENADVILKKISNSINEIVNPGD